MRVPSLAFLVFPTFRMSLPRSFAIASHHSGISATSHSALESTCSSLISPLEPNSNLSNAILMNSSWPPWVTLTVAFIFSLLIVMVALRSVVSQLVWQLMESFFSPGVTWHQSASDIAVHCSGRLSIFILSAVFVSHPNSRLFLSMVSLVISAGGAGLGAGFIFSSHSLILFFACLLQIAVAFHGCFKTFNSVSVSSSFHVCLSLLIDGGALPHILIGIERANAKTISLISLFIFIVVYVYIWFYFFCTVFKSLGCYGLVKVFHDICLFFKNMIGRIQYGLYLLFQFCCI